MAKSGKGNLSPKKNSTQKDTEANKNISKPEKEDSEDLIDFENESKLTKSGKKSASAIKTDDDLDSFDEEDDPAKNSEEADDWDPDFDEFDLPKSSRKVLPGKKSVKESDDEFKVDEEFEDFFNSSPKKKYDDDDDDY